MNSTITLNAHHEHHSSINGSESYSNPSRPLGFYIAIVGADAHEIAALFPKSVRFEIATRSSGTRAATRIISMHTTSVTGERNEAARRRVRSILRTLDKHALPYTWTREYGASSYETRESFERHAL